MGRDRRPTDQRMLNVQGQFGAGAASRTSSPSATRTNYGLPPAALGRARTRRPNGGGIAMGGGHRGVDHDGSRVGTLARSRR